MNTRNIAWITGAFLVIAATASWLSNTDTDTAPTLNTNTKANRTVSKQEVKPAIVSTAKPLVRYTQTNKPHTVKRTKAAAPEKKAATTQAERKLFSTDYLPLQEFIIDSRRDTQLLAAGGMKVSIPANAFVYKDGKEAEGKITIEMKEAFTPQSIVMANLVTMKGKELLESGGMYYLNAKLADADLAVADGKELTVEVPTLSKKQGMELYEGKQSKSGLDWANPVTLNKEEKKLEQALSEAAELFDIKPEKDQKIARVNKGMKKDGLAAKDSLGWMQLIAVNEGWINTTPGTPGNNNFAQDASLNYLMTTNRLGWANIDRLYHDPRSRRITFVTDVEGKEEFETVYITMMFKTQQVYLPGYEKKNGTYSFTHGDYEQPVLPVGENASIMVSAYKKGQQYFALKNVTISNKMNVLLSPVPMSAKEIEQQVNNSL